jgi:hypothetical protein
MGFVRFFAGLGWTDLQGYIVEREGWWFASVGLRGWDGTSEMVSNAELGALVSTLEGIPPNRLVLVTHVPPLRHSRRARPPLRGSRRSAARGVVRGLAAGGLRLRPRAPP